MADNVPVSSTATYGVATRAVTYSGDAGQNAQVVGLVAFSGADDAKTAVDIPGDASLGLFVNLTGGTATIGSVIIATLPALPAGTNAIGTVAVSTLPALAAGTNAIGTVAVSALPALAAGTNAIGTVAVSTLPALAAGTNAIGTVAISGTPVISGTVVVSSLPALAAGTNTIGTAVSVSADLTAVTQPLVMTTNTNAVTISGITGQETVGIYVNFGSATGTIIFEGSIDGGVNYFALQVAAITSGAFATTATASGQWQGDVAGFSHVRARVATAGTGTATVSLRVSIGGGVVNFDAQLPAGTNTLGSVLVAGTATVAGTVAVSGTAAVSGTVTNVADQTVVSGVPFTGLLVERATITTTTVTALSTFGATAAKNNHFGTIIVYNSSNTNGSVNLLDGTAGAVFMTIPLPANGGAVVSLPIPLRQPTANTPCAFQLSAALSTVFLTFVGFKAP